MNLLSLSSAIQMTRPPVKLAAADPRPATASQAQPQQDEVATDTSTVRQPSLTGSDLGQKTEASERLTPVTRPVPRPSYLHQAISEAQGSLLSPNIEIQVHTNGGLVIFDDMFSVEKAPPALKPAPHPVLGVSASEARKTPPQYEVNSLYRFGEVASEAKKASPRQEAAPHTVFGQMAFEDNKTPPKSEAASLHRFGEVASQAKKASPRQEAAPHTVFGQIAFEDNKTPPKSEAASLHRLGEAALETKEYAPEFEASPLKRFGEAASEAS